MTSPLHGEDPGFKSPWAHLILVTLIDPHITTYMDIELEDMQNDAYSNFIDSIRNSETKRAALHVYRGDPEEYWTFINT